MVTRSTRLLLRLWLLGGIPAGASEPLPVHVLSALGEPLLATLSLPSDGPTAPLSFELRGAEGSIAARTDPATPYRVYLHSDSALDAPIIQGTLRAGQGAKARRYPLTLFLDQRISPEVGPKGGRLNPKPKLEARAPEPPAKISPDPLHAELKAGQAALAAARAQAEADRQAWEAERAAQTAQLAGLRAELARQRQALEAARQSSASQLSLESASAGGLAPLLGAALIGAAGLAGLGSLLRRRQEPPREQATSSPLAEPGAETVSSVRAYEPSAVVQRFGHQSLGRPRACSAARDEGEGAGFAQEASSQAWEADAAPAAKARAFAEPSLPLALCPEDPTFDASFVLHTPGTGLALAPEGDTLARAHPQQEGASCG